MVWGFVYSVGPDGLKSIGLVRGMYQGRLGQSPIGVVRSAPNPRLNGEALPTTVSA